MTRRRGRAVPRPQRLEAAAAEHEAGVAVLQREPRPGQQARPRVRGHRHGELHAVGGGGPEVDGAPGVRPARGLAGPLEVPGLGVADVEDGHQAGVGAEAASRADSCTSKVLTRKEARG